jgi:hypothetical protein
MKRIDIAMTATRRPDILRVTIESFIKNVFKTTDGFRLILNVDPIGLDIDSVDVVAAAADYFDDIVYNMPEEADFNTAFRWVLSKADSDLVFHLQDDWCAPRPIDFPRMVRVLEKESTLALLRLSMFPSGARCMLNWGACVFPWNGRYFECPSESRTKQRFGFCGHPSLIKKEFLKKTIPLMDHRHNPENQFHSFYRVVQEVMKWRYGVFIDPNSPPNVIDIGRDWMRRNNWQKNCDKSHTVWHRCA